MGWRGGCDGRGGGERVRVGFGGERAAEGVFEDS